MSELPICPVFDIDFVSIAVRPTAICLPVFFENTPIDRHTIPDLIILDSKHYSGEGEKQGYQPQEIFDMFRTCTQSGIPYFYSFWVS